MGLDPRQLEVAFFSRPEDHSNTVAISTPSCKQHCLQAIAKPSHAIGARTAEFSQRALRRQASGTAAALYVECER